MIALARFFYWRDALVIVRPETFIRWHRTAFQRFWRWKPRKRGRPALPKNLRELIRQMVRENPTWGEEQIANKLLLKLGIRVSPRTVRKYLDSLAVRRHLEPALVHLCTESCEGHCCLRFLFFVSITASFQILYVFVAMEIGSRRILHTTVTAHPTAEWTLQRGADT